MLEVVRRVLIPSRAKVDLLALSRTLPKEKGTYDSAFRRARNAGVSVELYKRRRQSKVPEIDGEVLYGTHPVLEALRSGRREIRCVYGRDSAEMNSDIRDLCARRNIPVKEVSSRVLDNMSEYQLHNSVCADASSLQIQPFSLEDVPQEGRCAFLYLDGVLDPGNIGAIIRSATFFGINGILWARTKGPKRLTPSMSKASSGALEHFPVFSVESFAELHQLLKPDFSFVGTLDQDSAASKNVEVKELSRTSAPPRSVFVMGDEHKGVSREVLELCDVLISIPRSPSSSVASLNVSVATGLLLHLWASSRVKKL
uniref:rRNA methyltransferase 1, mitochondrial n=1 Tax=Steinernema glaseri TaxID=37863 RepID=A0A1I8AWP7_9BILA